jgi:hypothetical protein
MSWILVVAVLAAVVAVCAAILADAGRLRRQVGR